MTANDVIRKAYDEIGVSEYPPNSNNVKYNTAFYGKPVSGSAYPWCCTFIWWLLSTSGVKVPKTASCANMGNYYKKEGKFFTKKPSPGDLVFFKYNRTNNWTNHIGIVVESNENYIETIEGNTSVNSDDNGGAVMKRRRSSNIVGYARPDYDGSSFDDKPVLKRGSTGDYVKAWQNYLVTCGLDIGKSGADGIFGKDTESAVKQYQKLKNLPITGIIDKDDWDSVGK
jgi:peptidoglycan hydrolase-like protein with peptidoglycan-binding domain